MKWLLRYRPVNMILAFTYVRHTSVCCLVYTCTAAASMVTVATSTTQIFVIEQVSPSLRGKLSVITGAAFFVSHIPLPRVITVAESQSTTDSNISQELRVIIVSHIEMKVSKPHGTSFFCIRA